MTDEFEIKATGNDKPERIWTRNNLHASKMIADQAVSKLGYAKAEVVNTFGGDRSDPLHTAEEGKLNAQG